MDERTHSQSVGASECAVDTGVPGPSPTSASPFFHGLFGTQNTYKT